MVMKKKNTHELIESLYSFVESEFKSVRDDIKNDIKNVDQKITDLTARFDEIEIPFNRHERRITNLEDSNRIIKTKLGLV